MTTEPQPKRHGIIVVHGVGQPRPFDMLLDFSRGFHDTMADLLQAAGKPLEALTLSVSVDPTGDESKDNHVDVSYRSAGAGPPSCHIRIKEARWSESHRAHGWLRILMWLTSALGPMVWHGSALVKNHAAPWRRRLERALTVVVLATFVGGFAAVARLGVALARYARDCALPNWSWLSALGRSPCSGWARPGQPDQVWLALLAIVLAFRLLRYYHGQHVRLSRRANPGPRLGPKAQADSQSIFTILDYAINRAILAVLLVAAVAVSIFASLSALIPDGIWGKTLLQAPARWLVDVVLLDKVGDIETFVADTVAGARIRAVVEDAVAYFGDDAAGWKADQLHVIGHSLGSVVSYEVLSRTLEQSATATVTTLFTLGSPLDKLKWFFPSNTLRGKGWRQKQGRRILRGLYYDQSYRFRSEMPAALPWYNIRGCFDPVCGEIVAGDWFQRAPVDVSVENVNSIARDHNAYWTGGSKALRLILGHIWLGETIPEPAA